METEKTISNDQNIDVAEKEANAFAAKLLLPDKVLTNQILSGYTIHDISNISNISKQAIYWRIVGFAMDNLYAKHAEAMGYADEYKRTHKNSEVIKTSIHSLIYDRRLSTLSFDYG